MRGPEDGGTIEEAADSGQAVPGASLLDRRVLAVCDRVGEFIEYWGFKSVQGRIWTLLALSSHPRSQQDVARTLDVSKALVSSTMAELERLGLVAQTGPHRTAPYAATTDVWPVISDVLRGREWMLLERARLALEAAAEEMRVRGEGPYDRRRVEFLLGMTRVGQSLLRVLVSVRSPETQGLARVLKDAARLLAQEVGRPHPLERLRRRG
ncbi:MarR family transcriptional regulator [Myxococcota bacterium]|nr:MarR family transcriptional regulator [Myxococcota bacterium]